MKRPIAIGFLLGLLPLPICWHLMGLGEGTDFPFFLFYGATEYIFLKCFSLVEQLVEHPGPGRTVHLGVVLPLQGLAFTATYAAYAGILGYFKSRGHAQWALVCLLALHYVGTLVSLFSMGYPCEPTYWAHAVEWMRYHWWCSSWGILLFIALNALAVYYALFRMPPIPRRLQFTVRHLLVLTFLVALALSTFAVMQHFSITPRPR